MKGRLLALKAGAIRRLNVNGGLGFFDFQYDRDDGL
jgi:hypothetical protein